MKELDEKRKNAWKRLWCLDFSVPLCFTGKQHKEEEMPMGHDHSESRDQRRQALQDFFASTSDTIDPAALQDLDLPQIRQLVPAYAKIRIRKRPESVWRESKPIWSNMSVITFRWKNAKGEFWTVEVDGSDDQAPPDCSNGPVPAILNRTTRIVLHSPSGDVSFRRDWSMLKSMTTA